MESAVATDSNHVSASVLRVPDRLKTEYEQYLERRVFELLKDIRPWGINGDTLKWLLMGRLVQEEDSIKFPIPTVTDVDRIIKKYWHIDQVKKSQRTDEIRALEISTKDEKPAKGGYTTPVNAILGPRIFVDIGADVTVVREAARILETRKKDAIKTNKVKQEYEKYMANFDTLNTVKPLISVVKEKDERKAATQQAFAYETLVAGERWGWLADKKDQLRKSEKVEQAARTIFTDDEKQRRRATNASASSASSNTSKPANEAAVPGKVESNGESATASRTAKGTRKRKEPETSTPAAAPGEPAVGAGAAAMAKPVTRRQKKKPE